MFLFQVAHLIGKCEWPDTFVELKLWARLAHLAFSLKHHETVARCAHRAAEIGATGTQTKGRKGDG